MDNLDIYKAFQSSFNNCPPVGFMLRDTHGDRWLRIHSLPDSKRYPDNQQESDELLHRHLKVAQFVLQDTESYIFVGIYGDDKDLAGASKWYSKLPFTKVDRIDVSEEDD